MSYLIAWIALPLLVFVASWGVGLLVEQLARVRLPNGVTITLGFVCSFLALALPYELGLGSDWGGALLIVLALAGLVAARGRLAASLPDRWTAGAALAIYVVYISPVVLSGQTTFAGYTLLGDTAVHFSLIDYLSAHGAKLVQQQPSSFSSVTSGELTIGYPLGLHFELASIRFLLGEEVSRLYQPFLATTIALAAFPAAKLLRSAGITRRLSAAAAVFVLCAYLPYSYSLQGGIKELGMITLLMMGGFLAWELASTQRPWAFAALFGVVTAGAFEIYSYGGIPWFGLLGLAAVVSLIFSRRYHPLRAAIVGLFAVAAFAVAALPVIPDSLDFYGEGNRLLTSSTGSDLGNLIRPLQIWESFGVWLVDDFRLPPDDPEWTYVLVGLVATLVVFGVVWSIRRRAFAPLATALAALIVWLILPAGIYIDAKLLTILSTGIVLMAAVGGWALFSYGRIPEAALLVLAATIGIFVSDALAYHGLYLAPTKRLDELQTIDKRFSGQGPAMLNEFEEYGKHYLRDVPPIVPSDAWTPFPAALRTPGATYAAYYDLDAMTLPFVQQFPLIILRRSAVASRPPAQYRLVFRGRYYDVWRQTGAFLIKEHLPLGDANHAGAMPDCAEVRRMARSASPGDALIAIERPPAISIPVRTMKPLPRSWPLTSDQRVAPSGPGRVATSLLSGPRRYRVWFRGSFGRGATVTLDGRVVGRALSVQTPQQMSRVGSVTLSPGRHRLEIVRGGANLKPGNGQDEIYDAVFLEPETPMRAIRKPPVAARSLCGKHLDWIELVNDHPG